MIDLLFVYGTLKASTHHKMAAKLYGEATQVGQASIQGRLFDLGAYPGLVESTNASDRVHGEVARLHDPALSLAWLDPYESIYPGKAHEAPYVRVVRPVAMGVGGTLEAMVYFYVASVEGRPIIADGIWRTPHTLKT